MKPLSDLVHRTPWWALILGGAATLVALAVFVTPFHLIEYRKEGATPEENRAIKREIDNTFAEGALGVARSAILTLRGATTDPARRVEFDAALAELDSARAELREADREVRRAKREAIDSAREATREAVTAIEEARRSAEQALEMRALAQRVQADFENYKKRVQRDQAETAERGAALLVEQLLPVLDTFDLALASLDDADEKVRKGVELVYADLVAVLERTGLERIPTDGQPFDPEVHEAVLHEPGDGGPTVVETMRSGYRRKGRVLRPAMVNVSG